MSVCQTVGWYVSVCPLVPVSISVGLCDLSADISQCGSWCLSLCRQISVRLSAVGWYVSVYGIYGLVPAAMCQSVGTVRTCECGCRPRGYVHVLRCTIGRGGYYDGWSSMMTRTIIIVPNIKSLKSTPPHAYRHATQSSQLYPPLLLLRARKKIYSIPHSCCFVPERKIISNHCISSGMV